MSAIVAALQSQTITRLRLTYDGDAKRRTVQMSNTLDPRNDYAAYKAILRDSNSPYCIPWLGKHRAHSTNGAPLIFFISQPHT